MSDKVPLTKELILEKVGQAMIDTRHLDDIAAAMSEGVTECNEIGIGVGTIIESLNDIDLGNALIDQLYSLDRLKYVKTLIQDGRLKLGSPMVKTVLQGFVGSLLTQAQVDALWGAGRTQVKYGRLEVEAILYNLDGSLK